MILLERQILNGEHTVFSRIGYASVFVHKEQEETKKNEKQDHQSLKVFATSRDQVVFD
jgi:hypothetical protein